MNNKHITEARLIAGFEGFSNSLDMYSVIDGVPYAWMYRPLYHSDHPSCGANRRAASHITVDSIHRVELDQAIEDYDPRVIRVHEAYIQMLAQVTGNL